MKWEELLFFLSRLLIILVLGKRVKEDYKEHDVFALMISHKEIMTSNPNHSYGEKLQDHLLEQYKLYVEMIDRTSARRNQMNSFYTSLLSGLLALITIVTNKDITTFQNTKFQAVAFLAVALLGILLCMVWYLNIQSYKQLNSARFKVINELEQQLPFACYNKEWEFLKEDKRYK